MGSSFQQDPLSLLLSQDPGGGAASTVSGMFDPSTAPGCEPLPVSGMNGLEGIPIDAEEPGPLPCLPRAGRMGGPYGNHSSLLMQQQQLQQLQRCGYPSTGAPGPGGRQARPRRHSVTIGMLNENQQALLAATAASQLPAGWTPNGTGNAGPSQLSMMPQQSPQNKQLPNLGMQGALQQPPASAQLGLGQPYVGPAALPMQQQLGGQGATALAGSTGLGSSGSLSGMDFQPAYALNAPRMPGGGNSRRHSWAPMGAESSMAYARQCLLLQQQQQRNNSLTAQFGDAGALFVNQQQQDQLGLGGLGQLQNGFGPGGMGGLPNGSMLGTDGDLGSGANAISMGPPGPGMPLYGDLAKEQLAQHLQQQLQQLQLQQQSMRGRLQGAGRGLDPYAEPFVSQAATLVPQPISLGGNMNGMDPYTAALQQELLHQQQQTALAGLQFDDPSLTAAAASMYAPLQVNGVSIDSQLLVSPYVDNWDLLGSGVNGLSSSSNTSNSLAALANGLGAQAALQAMGSFGMPAKAKAAPVRSNGSNGSISLSSYGSSGTPSASNGKGSAAGQTAAAAVAAAAAASMVASLPPLSKVCSDAPWDLKKAADEDAKLMAQQQAQVQKLATVLEHSKTLQRVHAANAAAAQAAEASAAAAAENGTGDKSSPADSAQALFGYQLPDSGDDTWGGSSVPVAIAGGSCISQEPSNKLFVGNIGWWVTEEDLLHWFSRFGTVVNVKVRGKALV